MTDFPGFSKKDVVLVTGASSGIGRACAVALSRLDATVVLSGRNEQRLEETRRLLADGEHLVKPLDLTEFDALGNLVKETVSERGPISGFIHSAGVTQTLPLHMNNKSKYRALYNINVIAGYEVAKHIAKPKQHQGNRRTSFVFVASIAGVNGRVGMVGYSSTKGALIAGVKSMALELARKDIRVNCVSPGLVTSAMGTDFIDNQAGFGTESVEDIPLGLGRPEDAANACLFLLSDRASWITGTNLVVDGGYSAK